MTPRCSRRGSARGRSRCRNPRLGAGPRPARRAAARRRSWVLLAVLRLRPAGAAVGLRPLLEVLLGPRRPVVLQLAALDDRPGDPADLIAHRVVLLDVLLDGL